jgi:predicted RNase H-like HicB family nuclease
MIKTMKLAVVLEPSDEGGYTDYVPSLPGCISEGDSRDEALANIREAIELHLEPERQKLASLLDEASSRGPVCIRRKDGRTFIVRAQKRPGSPLDVPRLRTGISGEEIVRAIRESRKRTR